MAKITEITDKTIPELQVYAGHSEPQLLHWYEPEPGVFLAESPKVIQRAIAAGYEPMSLLMERRDITGEAAEIVELCRDTPLFTGDTDTIVDITGFKLIRGAICAMRRRPLADAAELCKDARRIAVLENVVNPANTGSIFRSAAALGIDAVLLTSGSTDPLYRRSSRVSMGTVFQVPWTYINSPTADTELLHRMGFATAAMALEEDSVNIDDRALCNEERIAIIMGTEGDGLAQTTISGSDYTVCIPMAHGVDSLNVAAASALAFWQIGRK